MLLELLTRHFHGDETEAFRFLRAFTPNVFHIPKMDAIERMDREGRIARSLTKDPSTENVRRNSQFHSMTMRDTAKILSKKTGKGLMELRGGPALAVRPRRVARIRASAPKRIRDCAGQMELFD